MPSKDDLLSKELLQSCWEAADKSYAVKPDIASKFLHRVITTPTGAVSSIFAFPGSHNLADWEVNTDFQQESASVLAAKLADCRVHTGFARRVMLILDSKDFKDELEKAVAASNAIIFTGHSLGGAVAILATLILLGRQDAGDLPAGMDISCRTFAAPIVGDSGLAARMEETGWSGKFVHVVRRHDIVPRLLLSPGTVLGKAGGLTRDVAQRGIKAFFKLLASRRAHTLPPGQKENETEKQDLWAFAVKFLKGCIVMSEDISKALGNAGHGLMSDGKYRPFGIFVFHTTTGSDVRREPEVALQMLYLTMAQQSRDIDTRPMAIVDEHFQASYETAVVEIVKADALRAPPSQGLSAFIGDASSPELLAMLLAHKKELEMLEKQLEMSQAQGLEGANQKRRQVARALEQEYSTAMTGPMDLLRRQQDALKDSWPEALFFTTAADDSQAAAAKDAKAAMRELWAFWRKVQQAHKAHELLLPGDDPKFPEGFFTKLWAGRGREYRLLVEPVDIVNWYHLNKQVNSGHYVDLDDGRSLTALSLEDNNRRPGRYILLQEIESRVFGVGKVKSSLDKAFQLKEHFGNRRWQDVLAEEQAADAKMCGLNDGTGASH